MTICKNSDPKKKYWIRGKNAFKSQVLVNVAIIKKTLNNYALRQAPRHTIKEMIFLIYVRSIMWFISDEEQPSLERAVHNSVGRGDPIPISAFSATAKFNRMLSSAKRKLICHFWSVNLTVF